MKNSLFYGFQYPHHGQHSAFSALARELQPHCEIVKFNHPSYYARYFAKIGLGGITRNFPNYWFKRQERRLRRSLKQENTLVHYFFPEDSMRDVTLWPAATKIALTLHQPMSFLNELNTRQTSSGFFDGLSRAELIFLMVEFELDEYRRRYPQARVEFVPHGVDTNFFHPAPRVTVKDAPFRILTVGSWLRDYNIWAEVAGRLAESGTAVEFTVICNKSTLLAASAGLARNIKVTWLSGISDPQLAEIYQNSDLLFLPLVDAWANNALLEAMSSGLPVLCSDLPATREYLHEDGLYAKSVDEFVKCIEALICAPSRREALGKRLRLRARNQYSWPIIAQKHLAIYRSLLE